MIAYAEFGKLRLWQFRPSTEITDLEDWEYMDDYWVGEAIGFSEWLRLEDDPTVLRSLAINFAEFPSVDSAHVLEVLGLPIKPGMNPDEVRNLLGAPAKVFQFADDRVTHDFVFGQPPYNVSCTMLNEGGLIYLVVMVP